jgi:hypothetical protein
MSNFTYELREGMKFDRLIRVHPSGQRDVMAFIERATQVVYEARNEIQHGRAANPVDAALYMGLAALAMEAS